MIFLFCTHHICPYKAVENKVTRHGKYTLDLKININVTPSRGSRCIFLTHSQSRRCKVVVSQDHFPPVPCTEKFWCSFEGAWVSVGTGLDDTENVDLNRIQSANILARNRPLYRQYYSKVRHQQDCVFSSNSHFRQVTEVAQIS
jgi:hypothetical protein